MKICQVERPLVATNRIPGLEHKHLQVVRDGSSSLVAVDAVGCIPGDWVICGVHGEFYPCKPYIFDATYEPVTE